LISQTTCPALISQTTCPALISKTQQAATHI
jgi:hypothetical protein